MCGEGIEGAQRDVAWAGILFQAYSCDQLDYIFFYKYKTLSTREKVFNFKSV